MRYLSKFQKFADTAGAEAMNEQRVLDAVVLHIIFSTIKTHKMYLKFRA